MSTEMAKHGKELSDDTTKTIIKLIESGHRASLVAQSLKITKSTISRFFKRWRIRGDTEYIPRAGRKNIVNIWAENMLSSVVKTSRRATLKDITVEFNERTPVAVSRRTGYTKRSVRKKIGIRITNKKKRIAWCRGKLHWTVGNQWKMVIFTDEMMIVLKPDGKLKGWRKSSEVWRPECIGYEAELPSINFENYGLGMSYVSWYWRFSYDRW